MAPLYVAVAAALVAGVRSESKFLSIGDWGDTEAQFVSGVMGDYSPEFILALGDNFYDDGVSSIDDPQFNSTFEAQFTADSLQVPWYVCAGNHDYYGGTAGIDAEISYSDKSDRWIYPELYYNKEVTGSDGTTFNIISIDTWRINGGDSYVLFDLKTGKSVLRNISKVKADLEAGLMNQGKHDVLLKMFPEDDPLNPARVRGDQEQLDWFNSTLCASTADWNLIIGHFPIYSATTGEHGNTDSLVNFLLPLLKGCNKGNNLYFSGHDHILQHNVDDRVNMFGSGAGARTHTGVNTKFDYLQGYHQGAYGFMFHTANSSSLDTQFVIQDGSVPYSATIDL